MTQGVGKRCWATQSLGQNVRKAPAGGFIALLTSPVLGGVPRSQPTPVPLCMLLRRVLSWQVLAKSFSWSGARLSAPRSESRASSPSSSLRHTPPVKVDLSKLQVSKSLAYPGHTHPPRFVRHAEVGVDISGTFFCEIQLQ